MIEYRDVAEFYYGNKKYLLLLDNDNKYFFLRVFPDKRVGYVTLKELIKLTYLFVNNSMIQAIEDGKTKNKKKIIPKVIIGTTAVTVSLALTSLINRQNYAYGNSKRPYNYGDAVSYTSEVNLDETQEFVKEALNDIKKQKNNFEIENILRGINVYHVYDFSGLDYILQYDKDDITYDSIINTISNNANISDKYKRIMYTLVDNLRIQYPYLDLRVWYENLKDMKVVEISEDEMKRKSVSSSTYAFYDKEDNVIYTLENYQYKPNTWEYQIIVHECCHPISSGYFNIDGEDVIVSFENKTNSGKIIDEAMNSVLAVRSYSPDEEAIAYQLQSNIIELMVDSMDNYTLQDYVEHNLSYFEQKLNEFNGNDLAVDVITLIELQYTDFHNDNIHVEQDQYYLIYDYVAKMYYKKHLKDNMTYDDAYAVRDEFIYKLTCNVPDEYNIDEYHLCDYFETYTQEAGYTYGNRK